MKRCLNCKYVIEKDNKYLKCLKDEKRLPPLTEFIDIKSNCKDFEEVVCEDYMEARN